MISPAVGNTLGEVEDQPAEGIDLQFVLFQAFIQVYAGNFMDFVKFRPGIGQVTPSS